MNRPTPLSTATLPVPNLISRSPLRRGCFFIALALACFGLSQAPKAFGVSPPPDGGYSGANTAEGQNALATLSSGFHNTALGYETLFSDTTGNFNTATGSFALWLNTTGVGNTANGFQALFSNTTGSFNTATGNGALVFNTTGSNNTANGRQALFHNTTGNGNVAVGQAALSQNTTAGDNTVNGANTAVGFKALQNATTLSSVVGDGNTGVGWLALQSNTTGHTNTAVGALALQAETTGRDNTGCGRRAMEFVITGSLNTGLGWRAGDNVSTASNVTCLGANVSGANVDFTTWIANVYGTTTISGTTLPVVVSDTGQLGTAASSRRFKKDIGPMEKASEAVLALKPVTFHYKNDTKGTPQFGLIAEEVAQVDPDLVVRDAEGEIYTVRYDAVNAMLLNEFLKEHRQVEEQEATIAHLKSALTKQEAVAAHQQEQIEALTAGLQRVSAQVEMSRPAPQMVLNNQ
jgi:uncharacterized coiled-coil protein SlyX